MTFPGNFPTPTHLPFNRRSLDRRFQWSTPDQDPGGRGVWLLFHNDCLLVSGENDPRLPEFDAGFTRGVFFGCWDGQPCRAALWPPDARLPPGLGAKSLIASEPLLPVTLLSLGGLGKMLLHWEKHSRHCPVCGAAMIPGERDWGKVCVACAIRQYPRVAPCAIVLVRRPGEVLLVRRPEYAPQRYGLVAGFVECGECLEETAVREVAEETGLKIANLRYVGSQCWPFPSQLMCGFVADYAGGEIAMETRELVDVCWFPVGALPTMPPKHSLARYILDTELARGGHLGLAM